MRAVIQRVVAASVSGKHVHRLIENISKFLQSMARRCLQSQKGLSSYSASELVRMFARKVVNISIFLTRRLSIDDTLTDSEYMANKMCVRVYVGCE